MLQQDLMNLLLTTHSQIVGFFKVFAVGEFMPDLVIATNSDRWQCLDLHVN